jgi:RIO kinase 3
MSEQLATDLQEKETKDKQRKENVDLAIAKSLEEIEISSQDVGMENILNANATSTEEKDVPVHSIAVGNQDFVGGEIETTETKDDLLIAQMLQHQFDNENDAAVRNEERAYNGNSKVQLSYEKFKILQSDHPIWEDSDDEDPDLLAYLEMDDRKRDWDYYETADKETLPMPRCGYQKIGKTIITKHDKELNQRSNGKRVMALPPGIHTGDGGELHMKLSNSVYNDIRQWSIKDGRRRAGKIKDKMEKATAEQAVDPQTKLILFESFDRVPGQDHLQHAI